MPMIPSRTLDGSYHRLKVAWVHQLGASPLKTYEKKVLDGYDGIVIRLLDEGVDERVEIE